MFSGAAQRAVGTYAWRMDLNLLPNPDMPIELGVPDFDSWGDSALLVAQFEHLHSLMCTLSLDIDQSGLDTGDPAVVNKIVNRLAGMSLVQAAAGGHRRQSSSPQSSDFPIGRVKGAFGVTM